MNVLFISNDASIFDKGNQTQERMRAYAKEIGTLHILGRATKRVEETDGTLTLHGYRMSAPHALLAFPGIARMLVGAHGIEIVSAQDPFENGWIALKAIKGTSAKLHLQVHTDFLSPWFTRGRMSRSARVPIPFLNRFRQRMADRLLPKAHGIRVVSKRIKDSLVKRYGTRIPDPSVIPVALSAEVPAPAPLPERPFTFTLLAVSRLEPEKRIEDIFYALARLVLAHPFLGLVIVGKGAEGPRLKACAKKLGLANHVLFAGERADARALMGSASAFIQASAYEGYGRTLVEAALARVPIITTDVGIVGEVLRGYEDALVAPVADPAALATHIRGIISDHQARSLYVESAEQRVKEHLATYADQPRLIAEDIAKTLQGA